MEKITGDLFLAENELDEATMLMGKVNALRSVWAGRPELINAELVGYMLGFSEARDEEVAKLQANSEKYWQWYHDESEKNEKLKKHIEAIDRTVERLSTLYRLSCEEKGAEDGREEGEF